MRGRAFQAEEQLVQMYGGRGGGDMPGEEHTVPATVDWGDEAAEPSLRAGPSALEGRLRGSDSAQRSRMPGPPPPFSLPRPSCL